MEDVAGVAELLYPAARFRPISSHGGTMSAQDGLVLHVTTNHFDPYGFFSNPNNGASSTWWIGETVVGKCNCKTPQDVVACEQYYTALARCWAQMAGNDTYQAVETSGVPTTALSAAQVHTIAHLYAWGHKTSPLNWPMATVEVPGARGFGWHGMGGSAWGGHYGCPGTLRKNQRSAIIRQANVILGNPIPHYTPTVDHAPRYLGLLHEGSTGTPVREWQQRMRNRGWKISVDGDFGPGTLKVVNDFEALLIKHSWAYTDSSGHRYTTSQDGKIGMCVWHAAWDAPNLP